MGGGRDAALGWERWAPLWPHHAHSGSFSGTEPENGRFPECSAGSIKARSLPPPRRPPPPEAPKITPACCAPGKRDRSRSPQPACTAPRRGSAACQAPAAEGEAGEGAKSARSHRGTRWRAQGWKRGRPVPVGAGSEHRCAQREHRPAPCRATGQERSGRGATAGLPSCRLPGATLFVPPLLILLLIC